MTDLEIIRAACVKANPDIMSAIDFDSEDEAQDFRVNARPIRLADVLLAIANASHDAEYGERILRLLNIECCVSSHVRGAGSADLWNLRADDASQQSPETLAFLANLLK